MALNTRLHKIVAFAVVSPLVVSCPVVSCPMVLCPVLPEQNLQPGIPLSRSLGQAQWHCSNKDKHLIKQRLVLHNCLQNCWQSLSEGVDKSRPSAFKASVSRLRIAVSGMFSRPELERRCVTALLVLALSFSAALPAPLLPVLLFSCVSPPADRCSVWGDVLYVL